MYMHPISMARGGISICFPDVCKTPAPPAPPTPIPYPNPNLGNATNKAAAQKTRLVKKPAATQSTKMYKSMGDTGGALKGIVASKNMATPVFQKSSSTVKIQGTRSKMANAHQQLMAFNGSESPDAWQAAVENYILAVSAVYIQLNED